MGNFCEGCGQPAISVTKVGRPICPDCIEEGYGEVETAAPANSYTVADKAALERIDDALGFLTDRERVVVLQAFARHAQQAREQALEEAAKVADNEARHDSEELSELSVTGSRKHILAGACLVGMSNAGSRIAERIRAIKEQPPC